MATLDVTRSHLQREVAVKLGLPRTPSSWSATETEDIEAVIKDGLRDFYYPIDPRTGKIHRWSFLFPQTTLTTSEPFSDGTIEVADGVVTFTLDEESAIPSWAANGEILADNTVYDIDTRDDDDQVTLIDTTVDVDSGTSYTLRRCKHDMPTDFGAIKGTVTYGTQHTYYPQEILRIDESTIREMRQNSSISTTKPQFYAIIPKIHVATSAQDWQMFLWPPADDVYVVWYTYERNPDHLSSSASYPLGGPPHARTIMYAVLANAEIKMEDEPGIYSSKYQESLAASIAYDKQASSADYYPLNPYPTNASTFADRSGLWFGELDLFS